MQKNRPVANWLITGAILIIIQILLGGITRLTGSGLSITEWKPILGALPPMNEQDWNLAFDKYKQIAQYKYIHNYFTLKDFKFIYFWEWLHRNWGRFMGIVFIVPFAYFIYTKKINRSMLWPMVILFLLGGLQGLIGWVMVDSGIGTERVYVSPVRLSVHFIAALILLVYVVWFALKLSAGETRRINAPTVKNFTILLLAILTVQLIYGAFMAGTHAGKAAITWPTINGKLIPGNMADGGFLENLIAIQFIHRSLAYLLAMLVLWYTIMLYRQQKTSRLYQLRNWPFIITLLQIVLGVLTVTYYLTQNRLWLGISHQLTGIILLLSLVLTYYFSSGKTIARA